jgi:membrane protein implicated in regulation of membrane protease activity
LERIKVTYIRKVVMPMEVFNLPLETIYLYGLIGSGILTILYVFFADVVHFDGPDFLNPVIIFAFVTIFSASGYLFEKLTLLHYLAILGVSAIIALFLVTILNVFILIPLSNAEESLVYKESDLRGRIGTVITAIPTDGYGEVMLESISGRIAKPATSFDRVQIDNGTNVLVVDIKDGVLQVSSHQEIEKYLL